MKGDQNLELRAVTMAEREVKRLLPILRLSDWSFCGVVVRDRNKMKLGGEHKLASISYTMGDQAFLVKLNREYLNQFGTALVKRLVAHELAHLVLAPLLEAFEETVSRYAGVPIPELGDEPGWVQGFLSALEFAAESIASAVTGKLPVKTTQRYLDAE